MNLEFRKKSFSFNLSSKLVNSKKIFIKKFGWIIKLQNSRKAVGFGEVSPLQEMDLKKCQEQLNKIPNYIKSINLYKQIQIYHPCIQSAINSALAEINGEVSFKKNYFFNEIDQTAILLNHNNIIEKLNKIQKSQNLVNKSLTLKWKVAIKDNKEEEKILNEILNIIKSNIKLRIDANGSWEREIANRWVDILKENRNLEWLEQPLAVDDIEGLRELNKKIPVALDESLLKYPNLVNEWDGWQIRRPSQERNPINLLRDLENRKSLISLSTSFETGIGRRWLYHLSYLQLLGPTPKVPGLALNKTPSSYLFSNEPQKIWDQL